MPTAFTRDRRPSPTLGLLLNQPPWQIDRRGFIVARNVRAVDGYIEKVRTWRGYESPLSCSESGLMIQGTEDAAYGGDESFESVVAQGEAISLIGLARFSDGTEQGIIGTNSFLYRFDPASGVLTKLNTVPFLGCLLYTSDAADE